MSGARVLVCGGRDFDDAAAIGDVLRRVIWSERHGIAVIIHGGARGADILAGQFAVNECIPVEVYPADWQRDGKAAGPIRNSRMLAEGKPDLVVAFPGGRGTADMVRKAEKAGVRVITAQEACQ